MESSNTYKVTQQKKRKGTQERRDIDDPYASPAKKKQAAGEVRNQQKIRCDDLERACNLMARAQWMEEEIRRIRVKARAIRQYYRNN